MSFAIRGNWPATVTIPAPKSWYGNAFSQNENVRPTIRRGNSAIIAVMISTSIRFFTE